MIFWQFLIGSVSLLIILYGLLLFLPVSQLIRHYQLPFSPIAFFSHVLMIILGFFSLFMSFFIE